MDQMSFAEAEYQNKKRKIDPPKREPEADYECQSGDTGRAFSYPDPTEAGCIASKWAEFMQQLG